MKLNQQAPNDPDETGFDQPLQDLVFTALDVELHAADLGNAARREETGYVQHLDCDRLGRAMVCEARGGIRLQHQLVLAVAIADGCLDDFHSAVMLKQVSQEFRLCRKRLEDDRTAAVPAENVATPGSPISSGVNHEVLGADRKITYQQTVAASAEKIPEGAWKATVPPGPESCQRPFSSFTDSHSQITCHVGGKRSRVSCCAWANQRSGAITILSGFVSSQAPHQLKELFATMWCLHRLMRRRSS